VFGSTTLSATTARRLFALIMAVGVLMLPVALPTANAEPDYPPVFYKISADTYMAKVGAKISFKAQTFQANSAVSYDVAAAGASVASGSTSANADGIARKTITFTVEGTNRVTMSGTSDQGEPLSLAVDVTITAAGGGNTGGNTGGGSDPQADEGGVPIFGGGLPRTGGEIALTALIGIALVGGGAALVVATRRRRTS
jgi:LPXTG-motif cell wall-anchored protein